MVPKETGATQGSRIKKRTSPRPRNGFSRAMERILAQTITIICAPIVKMMEFLTAL